jgi:hypothetical protein
MKSLAIVAAAIAASVSTQAQAAQEVTFFSNTGMSGARFTVTGPRTRLSLPYVPRSAVLQGGGSWQICSANDFGGKCTVIGEDQRNLNFGTIRSIRPLNATSPSPGPWQEIARLNVRDRADRDFAVSTDTQSRFREIKVCSERSTIRIRRAEVQLGNGTWQRLFLPLALNEGQCSDGIGLFGDGRRIRAVRFEYEAWTAGMERGTISVKALPKAEVQPR